MIESDVNNLIDVFELKVRDWWWFLNEFGWKFPFRLFFSLFYIIVIFFICFFCLRPWMGQQNNSGVTKIVMYWNVIGLRCSFRLRRVSRSLANKESVLGNSWRVTKTRHPCHGRGSVQSELNASHWDMNKTFEGYCTTRIQGGALLATFLILRRTKKMTRMRKRIDMRRKVQQESDPVNHQLRKHQLIVKVQNTNRKFDAW